MTNEIIPNVRTIDPAAKPEAEHEIGTLPASASNAPAVPLAGVPETPLSEAVAGSTGPAVPSTDHYVTEASPNVETSGAAEEPPVVTQEVSGE